LDAVLKVSRTRRNAPIIRELGAIAVELQAAQRGSLGAAQDIEPDANARLDALVSRVLGVVQRLS
jgi:hypothetical protein